MCHWNPDHVRYYYEGVKYGEYPRIIWEMIEPFTGGCNTFLDIGCGAGAFSITALEKGYAVTAVDICRTHLDYLEGEARRNNLQEKLSAVEVDFVDSDINPHDIAVATYCFEGRMSEKDGVAKFFHSFNRLGVLVLPGETLKTEFLADLLPAEVIAARREFSENGVLGKIVDTAAESGFKINKKEIVCDFGMPYHKNDRHQIEFMAQKLGINDLSVTRKHMIKIKTSNRGIPWLPNKKKMTVIMIKCREHAGEHLIPHIP